jgi:H+/Cl- antiporter ClcA
VKHILDVSCPCGPRVESFRDPTNRRVRRLLCVLVVVVLAASLGCASTPQRIAFDTLQTLRTSVEGYVTAFNAGYQAGTYSDAQRDSLGVLYGKWRAADTAAALVIVATVDVQASTEGQKVALAVRAILDFVNSLKGSTP